MKNDLVREVKYINNNTKKIINTKSLRYIATIEQHTEVIEREKEVFDPYYEEYHVYVNTEKITRYFLKVTRKNENNNQYSTIYESEKYEDYNKIIYNLNEEFLIYYYEGTVKVVSLKSFKLIHSITVKALDKIVISKCDNFIILKSKVENNTYLGIYNINGFDKIVELSIDSYNEYEASKETVIFTYNDSYMIYGNSGNENVYVYNTENWECTILNDIYDQLCGDIAVANNSNIVAIGTSTNYKNNRGVYLYDLDTFECIKLDKQCPIGHSLELGGYVDNHKIVFSNDDKYIVINGDYVPNNLCVNKVGCNLLIYKINKNSNNKGLLGLLFRKNFSTQKLEVDLVLKKEYNDVIKFLDVDKDNYVIVWAGPLKAYRITDEKLLLSTKTNLIHKGYRLFTKSELLKNTYATNAIRINNKEFNGFICISNELIKSVENRSLQGYFNNGYDEYDDYYVDINDFMRENGYDPEYDSIDDMYNFD